MNLKEALSWAASHLTKDAVSQTLVVGFEMVVMKPRGMELPPEAHVAAVVAVAGVLEAAEAGVKRIWDRVTGHSASGVDDPESADRLSMVPASGTGRPMPEGYGASAYDVLVEGGYYPPELQAVDAGAEIDGPEAPGGASGPDRRPVEQGDLDLGDPQQMDLDLGAADRD